MTGHDANPGLDEIELSLLDARVQSLRRDGINSAFSLVGHELRPYVRNPKQSPLPPSLQEVLARGNNQIENEFRASSMDDLGIGRTFWSIYKSQLRTSICNRDGELYKLLVSEGKTSTKAVITALVATIGVGTAFAGLVCGVAVIILEIGLQAFCEWTDDNASEPASKK